MANELRLHGRETFAPMGLEVFSGKKVIEIRHVGINKVIVVSRTLERLGNQVATVAIGDDTTDEDMFAAMPGEGLSVAVGDHPSKAKARLRDPTAVRRFLELIAESRLKNSIKEVT